MKTRPHLKFEFDLWEAGMLACGMDEVGRGAFAGPLVVGAVVLKPIEVKRDLKYVLSFGVNDSKLVSVQKRKLIKELLQEYVLFSTIQYIPPNTINEIGVGNANKLAFKNAAKDILEIAHSSTSRNDRDVFFLTDAFEIPEVHLGSQKNIIRGDATVFSIAAASILAKVHRDLYMEKLDQEFPHYGFAKHKGYGTKSHRLALKINGPSQHHRTEFIEKWI